MTCLILKYRSSFVNRAILSEMICKVCNHFLRKKEHVLRCSWGEKRHRRRGGVSLQDFLLLRRGKHWSMIITLGLTPNIHPHYSPIIQLQINRHLPNFILSDRLRNAILHPIRIAKFRTARPHATVCYAAEGVAWSLCVATQTTLTGTGVSLRFSVGQGEGPSFKMCPASCGTVPSLV